MAVVKKAPAEVFHIQEDRRPVIFITVNAVASKPTKRKRQITGASLSAVNVPVCPLYDGS